MDAGFDKIARFLYNHKAVRHVDFVCQEEYDSVTGKMRGVAHYRFNVLEKAGNILITPLVKTRENALHTEFPRTWIVIGMAATIPASLGILLKKIGEALNPKSALRKEAIQNIDDMKVKNFSIPIKNVGLVFDQVTKAKNLDELLKEFTNNDHEKINEFMIIFNNYKNALRDNKDIEGNEKKINEFFILKPELAKEINKLALEDNELLKKAKNPFAETPEMLRYKAILDEMDRQ